ncbi:unnamed protein product, partial [Prorocentrum cordatum]
MVELDDAGLLSVASPLDFGAIVVRGPAWDRDDADGGSGKKGEIHVPGKQVLYTWMTTVLCGSAGGRACPQGFFNGGWWIDRSCWAIFAEYDNEGSFYRCGDEGKWDLAKIAGMRTLGDTERILSVVQVRDVCCQLLREHEFDFKLAFQQGKSVSAETLVALKLQVGQWAEASIEAIMKEHAQSVINSGPLSFSLSGINPSQGLEGSVDLPKKKRLLGRNSSAGEKGVKLLQPKVQPAGAVQAERREEGAVHLATYKSYFMAVGPWTLVVLCVALSGIMFFQNCCNLWIAYWTTEDKSKALMHSWVTLFLGHEPSAAGTFLGVYGCFVVLFTVSNFAGHGIEIVGGVNASWKIFQDALTGTMRRPFRWWDANPPGRVLNRFSEDVNVMDNAITNILGVIFGAVLYFVSHLIVLSLANPYSLLLLPFIGCGLEYFAKYYRTTVRE